MLEYEWIESQKKWRCYDKKWNWIHFSGFGKTKSEAELNFHLNCTKIAKSNPVMALRRGKTMNYERILRAQYERNRELTGLILRMIDCWWPFVHGTLSSEAARKLFDEAVNIVSPEPSERDQ